MYASQSILTKIIKTVVTRYRILRPKFAPNSISAGAARPIPRWGTDHLAGGEPRCRPFGARTIGPLDVDPAVLTHFLSQPWHICSTRLPLNDDFGYFSGISREFISS